MLQFRGLVSVSLIATLLCGVMACAPQPPPPGKTYACGDPAKNHCYAYASVGDHILGFLTRIHISGINPGDGFATNEIWLRNYTGVSGWIELGYTQDVTPLHYFWAQRDETGLFTPHHLGDIPPEEFDTPVTFSIQQLQPGEFEVRIDGTRTLPPRHMLPYGTGPTADMLK